MAVVAAHSTQHTATHFMPVAFDNALKNENTKKKEGFRIHNVCRNLRCPTVFPTPLHWTPSHQADRQTGQDRID